MKDVIQKYKHTMANSIFPKTILDISDVLKKYPELKKEAALLVDAYHAETLIVAETELMVAKLSTKEEFQQMVRQDRLDAEDPDAIGVEGILNYALTRVTTRILNYANLRSVRDAIIPTGKTLEAIRQEFKEALFLSDPPQTALEWCRNHLRPIEIQYTSPLWHNIGIQRFKLAEAMLFGHFSEILFNAFKYADHSADWFLRITCGEEVLEDGVSYLTVCFENPIPNTVSSGLGSSCGVSAITAELIHLNGTNTPETTLLLTKAAEKFKITLHYQADLLRLPPKRNIGSILLRNMRK